MLQWLSAFARVQLVEWRYDGRAMYPWMQGNRTASCRPKQRHCTSDHPLIIIAQADIQCSCGSKWTGGSQLSSLSCGTVCSGNANQRCGGWPGQSSLYRSEVGADTPKAAGYLGCWQETTPKAVQGFGQWLDSQSVDSCRLICSAKNFLLSGLSNGKREYCPKCRRELHS